MARFQCPSAGAVRNCAQVQAEGIVYNLKKSAAKFNEPVTYYSTISAVFSFGARLK